jgi:hypothetical protein
MEYNELVTECTVADPIKAEIVKNALNAEGIRCWLEGIHQAGATGLMALDIKVQVRAGDADRAGKYLKSHEPRHKA